MTFRTDTEIMYNNLFPCVSTLPDKKKKGKRKIK